MTDEEIIKLYRDSPYLPDIIDIVRADERKRCIKAVEKNRVKISTQQPYNKAIDDAINAIEANQEELG